MCKYKKNAIPNSTWIALLIVLGGQICACLADDGPISLHLDDQHVVVEHPQTDYWRMPEAAAGTSGNGCYPNYVSIDPGIPHKPLIDHAGDINRQDCPPKRYCLSDCKRSGNPHSVAWWAKCSIDPRLYSAWYVGGDSTWVLHHKKRPRKSQEGTWGLDFDGWLRPRRVWLKWSCDRKQGGRGAYATDREPGPLAHLMHHESRKPD